MKNKSIKMLLWVACNILSQLCHSQDVITLTTGEEIKSKVVEIESEVIKYKKFENQQGPTYSVQISKVFMIHYQNGSKEVYNQKSEKSAISQSAPIDTNRIVSKNARRQDLPKVYRRQIVGGGVMTGLGVPCLITGASLMTVGFILNNSYDYTSSAGNEGSGNIISGIVLMAAGAALTIAGPIQLSKGLKHRRVFRSGTANLQLAPLRNQEFHFRNMNSNTMAGIALNF